MNEMAVQDTINQAAVDEFVAGARTASTPDLRTGIARLTAHISRGEGFRWHGQWVHAATIQATIDGLAAILVQRGHACIYCGFGAWERHERCEHE